MPANPQLFVDMDGVLADFDRGYALHFGAHGGKEADNVDWAKVAAIPHFYRDLPPMPDLGELWTGIARYSPTVLTGVPSSVPEARDNKLEWIHKHLGNVPVITCKSKDKCTYGSPGDILIDDWEKYKHLWVAMGGRWITHVSANTTLAELVGELVGDSQLAWSRRWVARRGGSNVS